MIDTDATWKGIAGVNYAQNFILDPEQLDAHWSRTWGRPRRGVILKAIGDLPMGSEILEVGCNVGNQLAMLKFLGWRAKGLELNEWAKNYANLRGFDVVQGTALALPFLDQSFDLAYTCAVFSHLDPARVPAAVDELVRVSRKRIWVTEYVNNPAGVDGFMWGRDWRAAFLLPHPELTLLDDRTVRLPSSAAGDLISLVFEKGGK